ncbi:hypothetical protein FIM1_912 [Kluyveromyces marxianus]|uniref:Uncharacterized protein n=1 Tax=Kluyveromyces marxianus TaxID=4911 RepID=A0ABX6EPR0_KLUMA|nr:hypothetical protein FIM1_912 [Kluyveromyces marxianus]
MTWHLLLGVAGLVSAATAQQTNGIESYIPPASGVVTPQASIRYSTSTLLITTTITTDTTTFTFSSTSTVTETYEGDAFSYTSTSEIPASTETVPTRTLETAVSQVSGGETIISNIPTTDFSTKLEGHVVTSLDSTIPYGTLYSSVLVSQASEVVSTEQIVHTSVEYSGNADAAAPVVTHTSTTTITKEYDTTILSLPYTTQTYTPSPAYGNGTATGTVIVWQSCYIVTRATTTTTLELDVVVTPGTAPASVSSSPFTTHTSTEFVPHTFTTINTYYVTTPVETDYRKSTSLSTSTVTSIETDEYVYETIEISGGSTFLTTVPVDTLYTQIYISAHETVVSGIEEETLTTTYTQGNPVSYLVSSYLLTTTETYRYDIPETTIASGDSADSSSSFTLLSFNSESSRQQNAPSIMTIILTIACVVMLPLVL